MHLKYKLLITSLLLIFCLIMEMEYSFDFIGFYHLTMLIGLIGIGIAFVGLVVNKKYIRMGLYILLFCIVEKFITHKFMDYKMNKSIEIGQEIISAIEKYKVNQGKYPEKLNLLVPEYLEQVPVSKMGWSGKKFRYYVHKEGYGINFPFYAFMICSYSPGRYDWHCDD